MPPRRTIEEDVQHGERSTELRRWSWRLFSAILSTLLWRLGSSLVGWLGRPSRVGLGSGLAYFLAGCIFTFLLSCVLLVVAWFLLTRPYTAHSEERGKPGRRANARLRKQQAEIEAQVAQQCGALTLTPQPGIYLEEYEGTLWSIPASEWSRDRLLPEHPPPSQGASAIAHRWDARVSGRTLHLKLAQGPLASGGAGVEQGYAVDLDLEGCDVAVVRECLTRMIVAKAAGEQAGGPLPAPTSVLKQPWSKRGPLELSHPDRALLYGQTRVFLFAESGATKEQWHLALSAQAHPASSGAWVRSVYAAYCAQMRTAAGTLALPWVPDVGALRAARTAATASAWARARGGAPPKQGGQQRESASGSTGRPAGGEDGGGGDGDAAPRRQGRFGWLGRLVGRKGSGRPAAQPDDAGGKAGEKHKKGDEAGAGDADAGAGAADGEATAAPAGGGEAAPAGGGGRPAPARGDSRKGGSLPVAAPPSAPAAPKPDGGGSGGAPPPPRNARASIDAGGIAKYYRRALGAAAPPPSLAASASSPNLAAQAHAAEHAHAAAAAAGGGAPNGAAAPCAFARLSVGSASTATAVPSKPISIGRRRGELPGSCPPEPPLPIRGAATQSLAAAGGPVHSVAGAAGDRAGSGSAGQFRLQSFGSVIDASTPTLGRSGGGGGGGPSLASQVEAADDAAVHPPRAGAPMSGLLQAAFACDSLAARGGPAERRALEEEAREAVLGASGGGGGGCFGGFGGTVFGRAGSLASLDADGDERVAAAPSGVAGSVATAVEGAGAAAATAVTAAGAAAATVAAAAGAAAGAAGAVAAGAAAAALGGVVARERSSGLRMELSPLTDGENEDEDGDAVLGLASAAGGARESASGGHERGGAGGSARMPRASHSLPDLLRLVAGDANGAGGGGGSTGDASLSSPAEAAALGGGGGGAKKLRLGRVGSDVGIAAAAAAAAKAEEEGEVRRAKEDAKRAMKDQKRAARDAARDAKAASKSAADANSKAEADVKAQAEAEAKAAKAMHRTDTGATAGTSGERQPHEGGSGGVGGGAGGATGGSVARVSSAPSLVSALLPLGGPAPPDATAASAASASGAAPDKAKSFPGAPPAAGGAIPGMFPEDAAHLVPGLLGLNMLLMRVGFELLAAQRLQDWLSNLIQRKLDDFKRPAYLHALKVVSLDLGTAFPLVKDIKAVAGPLNAPPAGVPWPQLQLQVAYSGCITLVVSTSVELQQAGLVKALQRAFGRMAGVQDEAPGVATAGSTELPDDDLHGEPAGGSGASTPGLATPRGGSPRGGSPRLGGGIRSV
ncbi:hypothetical protein FOA52_014593 [Chlamydomonas sp. UWO 241]|nr:hypothetical protein FOA52_014593 [Chlamydomonas sp. UWO 241]